MKLDLDTEVSPRNFYEALTSAYLPDCKILKKNAKLFINEQSSLQESGIDHSKILDLTSENIDLFNSELPQIFVSANIDESFSSITKPIQLSGMIYIITTISKNFGSSFKETNKRLKKIEKASLKLQELLELDTELTAVGASIFFSEIIETVAKRSSVEEVEKSTKKSIVSRFDRLTKELDYFSNLKQVFSDSIPAKWMQFGVSGPKESSALLVWVEVFASIWVFELGRKLTISNHRFSGREAFLTFAENCFEQLHPSLTTESPDVIRNAYEKLRSRGKFDYPDEILSKLV